MPYTFTLTTIIPASPQEVYDAWLDSLTHAAMTGGEATMSDEVGAEVSAWDNYITGRNLELVPGERIVQSWRTSEFEDEHEDSIITLTLEPVEEGTLLTLEHANVPDEQRGYEESGWQEKYFEPMVAYFAGRDEGAVATPAEAPGPERIPETAPRKAAPRAARSVSRRAAGGATGSAAPSARRRTGATKRAAKRPTKSAKSTAKSTKSATKNRTKRTVRAAAKRATPRAKTSAKKGRVGRAAGGAARRAGATARRKKSTRGKRR